MRAKFDSESHKSGVPFWLFFLLALVVCAALDTLSKMVMMMHVVRQYNLPVPPYTFLVFCFGILVDMYIDGGQDVGSPGSIKESMGTWMSVPPEVVLFVLLPPLLFEDASHIKIHVFRKVFWSSALLASVGVIMCSSLSAVLFKLVLPQLYGSEWVFDWTYCFLLGCILSATDPVRPQAAHAAAGPPHSPCPLRHIRGFAHVVACACPTHGHAARKVAVIAVLGSLGAPDRLYVNCGRAADE